MQQINLREINSSVLVGLNSQVFAESIKLGDNVTIGDNVSIRAKHVDIGDNVEIGNGVIINTDYLCLGCGTRLGDRSQISGLKGRGESAVIGERSMIANDTRILVGRIEIGDYTTIHNNSLLNGREPMTIGHNVWIGQNAILNSEDELFLGNNVGIGAYSSIYTHGYFGDLLEGCQVFKVAPVIIEDDVWILGSYNIISPGVVLGKKCLVLSGSNVTKSVLPNHTVGGSPARDMTDKLVPYIDRSPSEKISQMRIFVDEFLLEKYEGRFTKTPKGYEVEADYGKFAIQFLEGAATGVDSEYSTPAILIAECYSGKLAPNHTSVICLTTRQYIKSKLRCEVELLSYLSKYRARFVPRNCPIVNELAYYRLRVPAQHS